jgi:hypothetical protein
MSIEMNVMADAGIAPIVDQATTIHRPANPDPGPTQETRAASKLVDELCGLANELKQIKQSAKRGPQTQAAKDKVRMNAFKHGFTGQTLIMGEDEAPEYAAFRDEMLQDLAPVGAQEKFLANSITDEAWRLGQIRAHCQNLTAIGAFEGAGGRLIDPACDPRISAAVDRAIAVRSAAKELALLSLYMQRTQRSYERCKRELKEMQEERKAKRAHDLEQARMLYQLAETEGQDYDPQQDGFVFSSPELKAEMDLFHRTVRATKGDIHWRRENNLLEFPPLTKKAA